MCLQDGLARVPGHSDSGGGLPFLSSAYPFSSLKKAARTEALECESRGAHEFCSTISACSGLHSRGRVRQRKASMAASFCLPAAALCTAAACFTSAVRAAARGAMAVRATWRVPMVVVPPLAGSAAAGVRRCCCSGCGWASGSLRRGGVCAAGLAVAAAAATLRSSSAACLSDASCSRKRWACAEVNSCCAHAGYMAGPCELRCAVYVGRGRGLRWAAGLYCCRKEPRFFYTRTCVPARLVLPSTSASWAPGGRQQSLRARDGPPPAAAASPPARPPMSRARRARLGAERAQPGRSTAP